MLPVLAQQVSLPSGRILWVEIFGSHGPSRAPNAPTLLFANGMASTTSTWNSLVHSLPPAFLASHTLVLHDAANTGKSPYQPHLPAPTLSSLATDAKELLIHLGLGDDNDDNNSSRTNSASTINGGDHGQTSNKNPCYWIGHSFGAQQGLVAASLAPSFWHGLLLLAPQTDRVNPITRASMAAIKTKFASDPDTASYANEIWDTPGQHLLTRKAAGDDRGALTGGSIYGAFAREMALRQRSEGLVLAFEALLEPEGEGWFVWEGMKTEIVLVFGGRDGIAPVEEGEYALRKLKGVGGGGKRLVVWEEAGHWMNWECEREVARLVVELVGGLRE